MVSPLGALTTDLSSVLGHAQLVAVTICLTVAFSLTFPASAATIVSSLHDIIARSAGIVKSTSDSSLHVLFTLEILKSLAQKCQEENRERLMDCIGSYLSWPKSASKLRSNRSTKDFIIPITNELMRAIQKHSEVKKDEAKDIMLVLDLDETLIHSSIELKKQFEYDFVVRDEDNRQEFVCYKRPYCTLFLNTMAHFYTMSCFTASYSCYSDPIIDVIDPYNLISKRLYNTSLSPTNKEQQRSIPDNSSISNGSQKAYEKDLSTVSKSHLPAKIMMIDNSPNACVIHHDNLYIINSFRADDKLDSHLLGLTIMLLTISSSQISDIREILQRNK